MAITRSVPSPGGSGCHRNAAHLCPSQPRARRDLNWALPQSSQGDVCWGASD